jgi:hypothetical protein
LFSRKKGRGWRSVKVMRMMPEVGKVWRCGWGHHPDVGVVVVVGKALRHGVLVVHHVGGMVVVVVVVVHHVVWAGGSGR